MSTPHDKKGPTCWVVTDGKVGMEIQCLGLSEALGLMADIKRISICLLYTSDAADE